MEKKEYSNIIYHRSHSCVWKQSWGKIISLLNVAYLLLTHFPNIIDVFFGFGYYHLNYKANKQTTLHSASKNSLKLYKLKLIKIKFHQIFRS